MSPPKALFFDVFGTCVDWRTTVTRALSTAAAEALQNRTSINDVVRDKATHLGENDWADLTHAWRMTYYVFTRRIAADPSLAYKTVDQHHYDALRELLSERGLLLADDADGSLFSEEQITTLSLVWHYLDPWPDTTEGLALLGEHFTTCTLSNGNVSLLKDMAEYAKMPFAHLFSAEMFQSYKPSPKVYLGAAAKLGLRPEECCMVAAHLDDLKHAKANGLQTLYVERPQEERFPELRDGDFVDIWVSVDEAGFVAAAEKLGVTPT